MSLSLLVSFASLDAALPDVYAHLLLGDSAAACVAAKEAVDNAPTDIKVWRAYFKALSAAADEKGAFAAYNTLVTDLPDAAADSDILEAMAWTVLAEGRCSSLPLVRIMTGIGALFSQDAKGVVIIQNLLNDNNSLVRAVAVELACSMRDEPLQRSICHLLKCDGRKHVRKQCLKAVGELKMRQMRGELLHMAAHCGDGGGEEELADILTALVELYDGSPDVVEIKRLLRSPKAGIKLVGCSLVIHYNMKEGAALLTPLLNDHNPAVKAAAIHALGILYASYPVSIDYKRVAERCLDDNSSSSGAVKAAAAWLLALTGDEHGVLSLCRLIDNGNMLLRRQAAAALSACGDIGCDAAADKMVTVKDSCLKLTLALNLIGNKRHLGRACDVINEVLLTHRERIKWKEEGLFHYFAPISDDDGDDTPEMTNQLTRLELLNLLAISEYPKAQEAIKQHLRQYKWCISGPASILLLTEGDDGAVDIVKELLNDSNSQVRFTAALLLALWGGDDAAAETLMAAYATANRDNKEKILEALSRIATPNTLLFLVQAMQEPFQTLRIIAAAVTLHTLYH